VVNSDENKTFGAVFRTPVSDSTGIPHILEHSVLCGSRKYPIKEPFVELMKGSLNTFLNAFTYPDRTCYPVASTNTQVGLACSRTGGAHTGLKSAARYEAICMNTCMDAMQAWNSSGGGNQCLSCSPLCVLINICFCRTSTTWSNHIHPALQVLLVISCSPSRVPVNVCCAGLLQFG
jgi:hypothetical protein